MREEGENQNNTKAIRTF